MTMTERKPTMIAACGCPYDPEYDEGSLGWHLLENHPEVPNDEYLRGLTWEIANEVEFLMDEDRARLKPLVDRLAEAVNAKAPVARLRLLRP
jgi:hypothetical protein